MKQLLTQVFDDIGINADDMVYERFKTYCGLLLERNKVMNLTAITEPEQVYIRHFIDSVSLFKFLDFVNKSVIDVGCGAGFPGLPLKIAEPSIKLTLLDSLNKRVDFLEETTANLNLSDVICIHGRAEEQSRLEGYRDAYDIAVSRAVADLSVLCELSLPFVKYGGFFLAMKTADCNVELADAQNAIKTLGGRVVEKLDYPLAGADRVNSVIIIEKTSETPEKYPRRFSKIQKQPL